LAEDIAAGVQIALAGRMAAMVGPAPVQPLVFTGGVALLAGMTAALESAIRLPVETAPQPQMTAALGAALLAAA
jgi:activator of 2-hydroxyglutaryl-CoA dehydratase